MWLLGRESELWYFRDLWGGLTSDQHKPEFSIDRSIRLPGDAAFYTRQRRFPFKVASEGCAAAYTVNKRSVQLTVHEALRPHVETLEREGEVRASLNDVTEAAMQFFQGDRGIEWPAELYADKLHFLRYDVGLSFQDGASESLSLLRDDILHGEARRPIIELVGYGLSLLAAARMLDVNPDRFGFLLGSGSRPDFGAVIGEAELGAGDVNTKILTGDNLRVGLESKARSTHVGLLKRSRGPNELLESLIRKYASLPDNEAMLGFVITSQRATRGEGLTRITLADPGTPTPLSGRAQLRFLLGALVAKLRRIGAWAGLHSASSWLVSLGGVLSSEEHSLLQRTPTRDAFLLRESAHGREYQGRIFSDVMFRLGPNSRAPQMSRVEIERRLDSVDAGEHWFHGVRTDVLEALKTRDASVIRGLGLGFNSPPATTRKVAFGTALDQYVLGLLQNALPYAR